MPKRLQKRRYKNSRENPDVFSPIKFLRCAPRCRQRRMSCPAARESNAGSVEGGGVVAEDGESEGGVAAAAARAAAAGEDDDGGDGCAAAGREDGAAGDAAAQSLLASRVPSSWADSTRAAQTWEPGPAVPTRTAGCTPRRRWGRCRG